jgi:hypothetical protein
MRIGSWLQTLAIIALLPLVGRSQTTEISQPPVFCMYPASGPPTPANCPTGSSSNAITFSPSSPTSTDSITAFVQFTVSGCQGPLNSVNVFTNGANIAITFSISPYAVVCPAIVVIETLAVSLGTLPPGYYTVTSADTPGSFPLTVGPPVPLDFYPVTPCRVTDTRAASGYSGQFGPPSMGGGSSRTYDILSSPCAAGIPANVAAYSLNFTVVPPSGGPAANLTTWPTGLATMPLVSTLNYAGNVVANAAIVPAGTNGAIDVYVTDPTDVLFDLNGYFATPLSSGLEFYPVTPCRIADTRTAAGFTGQFGPPAIQGGATRAFTLPSSPCGIPATASAYSLNFTVVPPANGPAANLTTWPATQSPMPNVSTLNYAGSVVANAAIVQAGTNDAINVFVNYLTNVLFDTDGYFATAGSSGLHFYPVTPCRIADTRSAAGFTGQFGPPAMAAGTTRTFSIPASSCGIPATASAYSLNFTVVPPTGGPAANLTTWPTGQAAMPNVSTLNYYGDVVANAAIVPAGTNGAINVFVDFATDVLFDINGYFAP